MFLYLNMQELCSKPCSIQFSKINIVSKVGYLKID